MTGLFSRLFGRSSAAGPAWIEADALQDRLAAGEKLLLVDVRQPEEFAAPPGHLAGAVNVPLPDLGAGIAGLVARALPIVVVCKTDRRSARAAMELAAAGVSDVVVLRGGMDGWHGRGLPLERP